MFFLEKFPGSDAQTPRLTFRITVWKLSFRAMIILAFVPDDRLQPKDFSDKRYCYRFKFLLAITQGHFVNQIDNNLIVASSNSRTTEGERLIKVLVFLFHFEHFKVQPCAKAIWEGASLGNCLQIFLNARLLLLLLFSPTPKYLRPSAFFASFWRGSVSSAPFNASDVPVWWTNIWVLGLFLGTVSPVRGTGKRMYACWLKAGN